jgi:hypothetical protein
MYSKNIYKREDEENIKERKEVNPDACCNASQMVEKE